MIGGRGDDAVLDMILIYPAAMDFLGSWNGIGTMVARRCWS
jgi:hypothetical protein